MVLDSSSHAIAAGFYRSSRNSDCVQFGEHAIDHSELVLQLFCLAMSASITSPSAVPPDEQRRPCS